MAILIIIYLFLVYITVQGIMAHTGWSFIVAIIPAAFTVLFGLYLIRGFLGVIEAVVSDIVQIIRNKK